MKNINSKNFLKNKIQKDGSLSIKSYAAQCYDYKKKDSFDEVFLESFAEELKQVGEQENIAEILNQFQQRPVLQTAHHIAPTNGPTFSAIDLISLAGLEDNFYLVGAFGGVVFSNPAFTGSLCYQNLSLSDLIKKDHSFYKILETEYRDRNLDVNGNLEKQIRLISSHYKDDLIYGSDFTKYRLFLWNSFTPLILKHFPKPLERDSSTDWSLKCCQNIQRKIFQKKEIVYFDLCRLVKNYLQKKLLEKENLLKKILILLVKNNIIDIPLFYNRKKNKKYWKIQPLNLQDLGIAEKIKDGDFGEFSKLLENNCPSIFLVFLVITFSLGIKTLGSFYQILYLPQYENLLKKIYKKDKGSIFLNNQWEKAFISGKITTKKGFFYPLDAIATTQYIDIKSFQNQPIKSFWEPLIASS